MQKLFHWRVCVLGDLIVRCVLGFGVFLLVGVFWGFYLFLINLME